MREGCILICIKCRENAVYVKDSTINRCSFCKNPIDIDRGIVDLVIALNNINIGTYSSCMGYSGGFDENRRSYPYVAIYGEGKTDAVKTLLKRYNKSYADGELRGWQLEIQKDTLGRPIWIIVPLQKEKNVEELRKEASALAEYIFSNS